MKKIKLISLLSIVFVILGAFLIFFVISSVIAATKIDDAGDPGAIPESSRQVVRTSAGTLYAVINDGGSCEVWKSSDGTSWSEVDSADNPACTTAKPVVVAIDTSGILHIAYIRTVTNDDVFYMQLNTSTDQFGSEETIMNDQTNLIDAIAIAVDSNSIPHVVYNNTDIAYDNRIGGAWNGIDVTLARAVSAQLDIAISEDNIPEISYIDLDLLILTAAVGNVNDAASFTLKSVDTTINSTLGIRGASIAIDSSGNTWIGYIDENGATDFVTLVKHNDLDVWATWQTPVTNSNAGNEPSIAINGTDVYIFYEDELDDIKYDRYTGTWLGETNLQTGTYQDVHVKWSFNFNNQGSTQIDYLFSDGIDISWDKLVLPAPTKVVFTNAARTQLAGACGGSANVFTIQLQDAGSAPINPTGTTVILVTSNSPSYTIYSDDTCATLVSNGNFTFTTTENTKNFYLVDNIVSAPTWTFTAAKTSGPDSITSGTQTYTINEGAKSTKIRGGVKIQGGTKIQ